MILNPVMQTGNRQSATDLIIGHCTLLDVQGTPSSIPIYAGFHPLDAIAVFETLNDVEQVGSETAEYISWASLKSGDFLFYRGVKDGDTFLEKVV